MRKIPLSQGMWAVVDDEDYDALAAHKWYFKSGYAMRAVRVVEPGRRQKIVRMHREVLSAKEGLQVDHINHDTLDNRKENLRLCTHAQNQHNRLPQGAVPYKGVIKKRGRYAAKLMVDGMQVWLGMFDTPEEAALAYNEAARKHNGEYAWLNKVV